MLFVFKIKNILIHYMKNVSVLNDYSKYNDNIRSFDENILKHLNCNLEL